MIKEAKITTLSRVNAALLLGAVLTFLIVASDGVASETAHVVVLCVQRSSFLSEPHQIYFKFKNLSSEYR